MKRLVDACWVLFKAGVGLALVAALVLAAYFYARMDDELRRHVERALAEKWPHLRSTVGGARLIKGRGLALYDVTIADPGVSPAAATLFSVDEVLLVADVQLSELMQGRLDVRRVEARRPQAALRKLASGDWNIEPLLTCDPCRKSWPQILVRDGAASIVDEGSPEAPPLLLREVTATAQVEVSGESAAGRPTIALQGSFAGPLIKRVDFHGRFDGIAQEAEVEAQIDALAVDESLMAWIRPWLPPEAQASRLSGRLTGTAQLGWRRGDSTGVSAAVDLQLQEGRLEDPRLGLPVTDAAGRIAASGERLQLDNVRGQWGPATIAVSLNRNGWGPTAPAAMCARAEGVPLDDALYRVLPPILQKEWDKYKPAGEADGRLEATFDGAVWRPTVALSGRKLSFESDKLPYRLSDGSGSLNVLPPTATEPLRVTIDLIGVGGGQPIHIVGRVDNPAPGAAGWVTIAGEGLEVEPRMIEALTPAARAGIGALHPAGKFNLAMRVERTQPGAPPDTTLELALTNIRINYDKFPYPLQGIRGTLHGRNGVWHFRDLISSGRRTVRCEGGLRPVPEGTALELRFTGSDTPLEGDLFDALPEAAQKALAQLQPRGRIDLTADVTHVTGQPQPHVRVVVRPRPESAQIRPLFFPYLVERLEGAIVYDDGRVEFTALRGEHDRTVVRTSGAGQFAPDGAWQVRLTGFEAERIAPRNDLISALPRSLGKLVDRLQPTGGYMIHHGTLDFRRGDSPIAGVESSWDLQIECHQADLQCGVALQNIHGSVHLTGSSDGQRSSSAGELSLETASFQGVQFTDVRGPLWIDESECRLGRWATDVQRAAPRRLTAGLYGGTLAADARVLFEALPKYGASAELTGVDLHRLVVERLGGEQGFQGKIDANVELGGEGYKVETLLGKGDVRIRDANIYELPLLASLLQLLRTGSSDSTAFTESQIQYRLQGRHIYLDKLDFLGDVVSLYGKGYTNFDKQLYLIFSPSVLRHDPRMPMVRAVVGQLNQQIMQMTVEGTLTSPQVTTKTLPRVNQFLQQVGADWQGIGQATATAPLPAAPQTR